MNMARAEKKWGTQMYSTGYICRNPNRNDQMHHYDMNLNYIDELLWHFQYDADKAYMKKMWPVLKSHLAWEKRNFDPDNLVALPRKYIGQLNNPELPRYHDRDTLLACIALCDLRTATIDAERSRPRKCKVCGATFTPTEKQRSYKSPVQTCPGCLAAGKRARGDRGDKQPTVCAVCGETFAREMKTQIRCPECRAAKPKTSPENHRRYYERHGHR